MEDYRKMYLTLFHSMTDAIERMQEAMLKAEELYISAEETGEDSSQRLASEGLRSE